VADEDKKKKIEERRKRIKAITKKTNNYKINIVYDNSLSIFLGEAIHRK